jgi:proteic killer suppression protein
MAYPYLPQENFLDADISESAARINRHNEIYTNQSIDTHNVMRYSQIMIQSFADPETMKIWQGVRSRRLPPDIQQGALRKLRMLNQARVLQDLRVPPGNRLEPLKGDMAGQYSIRINQQWRICFTWQEGGPADVQIIDYHA